MADNSPPDWLLNMPTRSEEIGFSPDQMKLCDACGKSNAPGRAACLYCGVGFPGVEPKLDLREVESWENGVNVIAIASRDVDVKEVSSIVGIEVDELRAMVEAGRPIPVARVESDEVAMSLSRRLSELGIECRSIADAKLAAAVPPTRLRDISFYDEALVLQLFNTGDTVRVDRDDIALIVVGVVLESRREAMEKRKRGSMKTLSESETSSDSFFIDIYSRNDSSGWRIPSSGFDFSSVGNEKSLLAGENLRKLIRKLADFAPQAKLVDDYADVRAMLEYCWPSESKREAFGFQRSGFARKDLSSVATTNNQVQVNKYSRLQWHLL